MTNILKVAIIPAFAAWLLLNGSGCHHPYPAYRDPVYRASFPPAVPAPHCNGYAPHTSAAPITPPLRAAPLPPAPHQEPTATSPWQPVPGVKPHVTETRPVPAPSPNGNGTRLLPPEPPNGARLQPPLIGPEDQKPTKPTTDPLAEFPPDIPQYSVVYDQVATGLQPFPEGWDWLKKHGFHTVLHIRAPDDDDKPARDEVTRRGMLYVSLEVTPQTLNRDIVKKFSEQVRDAAGHPLFVYDRKGMLAGSLWYLHFRLTDNLAEPQARSKAVRLGLKEDTDGEFAELWLAINQLLRGI